MLFVFFIFLLPIMYQAKRPNTDEYMFFGPTGLSMSLSRLSDQENADLQAKCGSNNLNQPVNRIAGGTLAQRGQFPWAVSLVFASERRNFCGASLISNRHILTALHCVFSFAKAEAGGCTGARFKLTKTTPESIKLHYGGVCIRVEESDECNQVDTKIAYIKKVLFLKEFIESGCRTGADFAIIEMDRTVQFSSTTQPICLKNVSTKELGLLHSTPANFSGFYDMGWGKDAANKTSARLKFMKTRISMVRRNYLPARAIDNPDGQRTSICIGDSGGPLVGIENASKKAVLLGIHSSGNLCNEPKNDDHMSVFVPNILDNICKWSGICPEKEKSLHI